ncbi:outer membrane protein assembly factor BamE [Pseudomonas oligotrophica]|uniref:outer membrane protein assembly factor BamE n=1 Tax=Pseudomonas oligotrophica TaxID=2912055 RepID=UPI001F1B6DF8|nr:outer membrane protein assembly factor BamE [Pseudomonas oligotrophica]MCF7201751.1 outer membrane protein assembly factor BamE [Pseudomonas oligotrophica]
MQNTKLMLSSLTLVGLFALAGCSFPGVYKVDIQQGNVVTQDMIDQLRPGMTRKQVRFIMGNPLITDTFHANRWDYLYSIQPGGSQRQQERVSLVFDGNDQLVGLAGDFMPGVSRDEAILGTSPAPAPVTEKPVEQPVERPAPGSLLEEIQREVDAAEPVPVPIPDPLETE